MDVGYAIFAVLLGLALFGYLRARDLVGRRWGVPRKRLFLGAASTIAVLILVAIAARSTVAALVLALILATVLWIGYKLGWFGGFVPR